MIIHHTLPPKIFSKILRWVVVSRYVHNAGSAEESHAETWAVPTTLRLVCREWDNIALSEPSLWSEIHIDLEDRASRPPAHIVSSWLSRSKWSMLYIYLDTYPIVDGLTPGQDEDESHVIEREYFVEVFTLLARHASRWKTLCISAGDEVLISPIFLDSLTHAKSLRNVCFDLLDLDDAQPEARLSTLASTLDQLPSLRSLTILVDDTWISPENAQLFHYQLLPNTLSRILELHIDRVDVLTALSIVRHCQSLKSLSLRYMVPLNPTTYPSRIRLPSLESLILHHKPWDAHILPHLDLPSLNALSLFPNEMADCHKSSFVQHLNKSLLNAPRIPRVMVLHLFFPIPPIIDLVLCPSLWGVALLLVYMGRPAKDEPGLRRLRMVGKMTGEAREPEVFITRDVDAIGWMDWEFYKYWASQTTNYMSLAIAESIQRSYYRRSFRWARCSHISYNEC